VDHLDAFAAEDLIEGGGELAVAVVDQTPHSLEDAREAAVARLLGHPGARRVGRAARQMDAAAFEFEEEEHVEAAERDRLDGQEIASEHAGRLLPTQKRLWRHDESVATPWREQSGEGRKQRAIGWPQSRAPILPSEHDQLSFGRQPIGCEAQHDLVLARARATEIGGADAERARSERDLAVVRLGRSGRLGA